MTAILDGIRVVDLCEGLLAMAGGIFADHGAEVIKIEPPEGDWSRASDGFQMWNRGKLGLTLDPDRTADRAALRRLADGADVLIHALTPAQASSWGLDWQELRRTNPRLVLCRVSGFGQASAHAPLGAHERIVMAKSGRMMGNGPLSGSRVEANRPIYLAAPFASFGAVMLAVQGALAALLVRRKTGEGQVVDTSLLDGISAATMRLAFERRGDQIVPVAARGEASALVLRGIMLCFLTTETSDGRYIQFCCRQKHLFTNWMDAIGLGELYRTERWSGLPLGLKSFEDAVEWDGLVREHMKRRTQAEWMELFRKIDVGADPFLTFDEFLDHPQMTQNDRIRVIDDPNLGPVKQIGPLVTFERTPADCSRPAPRLGQHQAMLEALSTPRPADVLCDGERTAQGALEEFTIVEAASFLAAPLGPTLLAEMGARVIKIEPLEGDPFRGTGLEFVHICNGKESIAVDLKSPAGREILQRIIAKGDALIHNFRPGVPEKLGMSYEQVRAVNPRMVYLYGASYGSKGPENHRAAFHPTPNALSGGGILQAGEGNVPVNDSYGDPCSGVVAGVALMLGLYAREVTGQGQYLETSMLSSVGFVHSERLVRFAGSSLPPAPDREQRGAHALDRLYPCKSGWVMLCALREHEWRGVARVLGAEDWLSDPRFADARSRRENDAALTALIEAMLAPESAAEWEHRALQAGLPLASAADGAFEEFVVREGLVTSAEHVAFGAYWQLPPRLRLSETPTSVGAPCVLGEHTVEVLKELRFTEDEIEALIDSGVVKVSPAAEKRFAAVS